LLYVVIYEGRNGPRARPIIASRDPEIVRVVSDAISARLRPIPKLSSVERAESDEGARSNRREHLCDEGGLGSVAPPPRKSADFNRAVTTGRPRDGSDA
jgi:hypothetical protein